MAKTAWFDRKFKFGYEAGMLPFFLERLHGSIARLQQKTHGVPDAVLSTMLDGKWSIKQNIGHLAEVDEIANQRLAQIVAGVSPMAPAVVQPGRDYNAMSIDDLLEYFRSSRTKNLGNFTAMREEDFTRTSIHPRLQVPLSVVDIAYFDAEHDDHHIVRINEIIAALNS